MRSLKGTFLQKRGLDIGQGLGIGATREKGAQSSPKKRGPEDSDKNLTFLAGLVVEDLLVTGADDGYVGLRLTRYTSTTTCESAGE